ncbi:MAG: 50S ribosomal protein L2 [Halobacteriales archaeon]|nr:50S ribosomal protein L2 [Halobacteriales archaeon]
MGKRIIARRRGKGHGIWSVPGHRFAGPAKIPMPRDPVDAVVHRLFHDPGHNYPLAELKFTDNGRVQRALVPAAEGTAVGQLISINQGEAKSGNVLPLQRIPDAMPIFAIEGQPGDGSRYVRAPGTSATIVSHDPSGVVVKLPSGQFKTFHPLCRAVIGIVAGGGRKEKPWVKAGKHKHGLRSKRTQFPVGSGVAKNPVDHPHGGGQKQHEGKPTTVSRNTPPGRKVGHIAAKRTGIRKG